MIEVDQFAKIIKLSFSCPRCGKHIGYVIDNYPQPDLLAENYSDSIVSDSVQISCFSCKSEKFDVEMYAGNGDKYLTISNIGSPYRLNEAEVDVITVKDI